MAGMREPATAERVLLIEDTRALAELYRSYLRDAPWVLGHAATAAEARVALGSEGADVVLLDLRLPDADGLDLLREVRSRPVAPPVIVITANGSVATAVAALRAPSAHHPPRLNRD